MTVVDDTFFFFFATVILAAASVGVSNSIVKIADLLKITDLLILIFMKIDSFSAPISGSGPDEILVCDVTHPFKFQDARDARLGFGRRTERYVIRS